MGWFKRRTASRQDAAKNEPSKDRIDAAQDELAVYGLQPAKPSGRARPLFARDAGTDANRDDELWESSHLQLL